MLWCWRRPQRRQWLHATTHTYHLSATFDVCAGEPWGISSKLVLEHRNRNSSFTVLRLGSEVLQAQSDRFPSKTACFATIRFGACLAYLSMIVLDCHGPDTLFGLSYLNYTRWNYSPSRKIRFRTALSYDKYHEWIKRLGEETGFE